jgi:hypothetical protein
MDQIVFEVPTGIEGCNVPVWVRFSEQGHGSNGVYVSINSRGGTCSDPYGLSESDSRAIAEGSLRAARIHGIADDESVEWLVQFGKAANGLKIPLGTCAFGGWDLGYSSMNLASALDAGESVTIRSERAAFDLQNRSGNTYWGRFGGGLPPGEYSLDNGTGGPDLSPVRVSFSVPPWPMFTWTNRETLKTATLGEGVTVTWTGGDSTGHVIISGVFVAGGEAWGNGEFVCYEQAGKGAFTIPPALISRLASDWMERPTYPGANSLSLWVGYRAPKRLEIPGFGVGEVLIDEPASASSFINVVLQP